jgi:AraC-like DNA-binding protein
MNHPHDVCLSPLIIHAWTALYEIAKNIGPVTCWRPVAGRERIGAPNFEQHCIPTLVLGVKGTTRVTGVETAVLGPGDALVIGAGTWHQHLPQERDVISYRQGFLLDRSDLHLVIGGRVLVGSISREPSWQLFQRLLGLNDQHSRQRLLREILDSMLQQAVEPLKIAHPAMLAMEFALWESLHLHLGVDRIISASGLHRAQAYRLAQSHWGMGIAKMRMRARMQLAAELLASKIPLGETCFRCGYGNIRSFSRIFRSFHGYSPSLTLTRSVDSTMKAVATESCQASSDPHPNNRPKSALSPER